MIEPAGRAAIPPPAMAAPPPPPPPPSGAVDGLTTADRASIRLRCLEIARDIGKHAGYPYRDLGCTPATPTHDLVIATARRLEAYALGQDREADRG